MCRFWEFVKAICKYLVATFQVVHTSPMLHCIGWSSLLELSLVSWCTSRLNKVCTVERLSFSVVMVSVAVVSVVMLHCVVAWRYRLPIIEKLFVREEYFSICEEESIKKSKVCSVSIFITFVLFVLLKSIVYNIPAESLDPNNCSLCVHFST